MRKTLLSTLAVAVLLGLWLVAPASSAQAAEWKPVVTVSFSGYDELVEDINFIGKLGNNPALGKGVEAMLKMFVLQLPPDQEKIPGLDTSKPWGALVETNGAQFRVYGFVPVTDLGKVVKLLEQTGAQISEGEGGVYELDTNAQPVFIKQQGGWAMLADSPDSFEGLPADPSAAIQNLSGRYDLAVGVAVQNIPKPYRDMAAAQLQLGAQAGLQQKEDESDEQFELRVKMSNRAVNAIVKGINEINDLTLGFAINRQRSLTHLDLLVTALDDTELSETFGQVTATSGSFAGFDLPGAAVSGTWAAGLSDNIMQKLKSQLADAKQTAVTELKNNEELSDADRQLATDLLDEVMKVAEATIDLKKIDGGMAMMLKPENATLVAGGIVAEGDQLQKVVERLIKRVEKEEPELAKSLKLNVDSHEGVNFHTMDVPAEDEETAKMFGDPMAVTVGLGKDAVYLAMGREGVATIKQVIDGSKEASDQDAAIARVALAFGPILQYAATTAPEDQQPMLQMAAAMVEQAGEKDHLLLKVQKIPGGIGARLELEEGLLKLIGSAGNMAAGGGAAPGGFQQPAPGNDGGF